MTSACLSKCVKLPHYQRIQFCIQLQSYRSPLSCSHSNSSKKEHCNLYLLNFHKYDGCVQTFQSVWKTWIICNNSLKLCVHVQRGSYLDGQQTGVVTKAFWKNMPLSVSNFFSCGWTSREPSLISWSSVIMYTAKKKNVTILSSCIRFRDRATDQILTNIGLSGNTVPNSNTNQKHEHDRSIHSYTSASPTAQGCLLQSQWISITAPTGLWISWSAADWAAHMSYKVTLSEWFSLHRRASEDAQRVHKCS